MVPCLTLIFLTSYTKTFHSEKTVRLGGKSAAATLDGAWRQKLQARNATMRELHSQGGTVGIVATPQDFPRPAAPRSLSELKERLEAIMGKSL